MVVSKPGQETGEGMFSEEKATGTLLLHRKLHQQLFKKKFEKPKKGKEQLSKAFPLSEKVTIWFMTQCWMYKTTL